MSAQVYDMRDYDREMHDESEPTKLPPHNPDAERAVLSACLLDPMGTAKVADFLRPDHFYLGAHSVVFRALLDLHEAGKPIDVVTVAARIDDQQKSARIGGPAFLADMLCVTPHHTNVRYYAELVYDRWRVREIISTAQRIVARGYNSDTSNAQAYADDAAQSLGAISRKTIGAGAESNVDVLKRIVREMQERAQESGAMRLRGLSYGFRSLDAMTGGMHPGESVYVIALTGVGKTTFAINVALKNLASGIGVLVFSTETTRQEYLESLVSCHGGVDNAVWTKRTPNQSEWSRMVGAMQDIAGWKHLAIDATVSPDIGYVESTSIAYAETAVATTKKPLGLVVIDNLHCLAPPPQLERAERPIVLKNASERIKRLARRLGVPVLVLAQRRDAPFDKSKIRPRPQRGELSYCRTAEQDADKVFYLHNPPHERNGKLVGEDKSRVLVIPTKLRRATDSDVELVLNGPWGRLTDPAGESAVAESRHWADTDAEDES